MRIKDNAEGEESSNMTPLIDMVFLLLVFFLVATQFAQEEREVAIQLPSASTFQPLSAPPPQLVINVADDGRFVVAGETYEPAALRALLAQVARHESARDVLVRADERVPHRYFADVVRLSREAGVGELKIGYLLDEQNGGGE